MLKKVLSAFMLFVGLSLLVWSAGNQSATSKSLTKTDPSTTPSMEAVSAKLTTLERGRVENEGQWDERALFSAPGYFGNTWITKDGGYCMWQSKERKAGSSLNVGWMEKFKP